MYPYKQPERTREIPAQSQAHPSNRNTCDWKQALGGGTIIGLTLLTMLLWFLFRPAGQPTSRYVGEMLGTTAIVLFSCSLIVATKAPLLERFFGGLDRMYVWHRRNAIAGVVLLFPHYVLVTSVPNTLRSTLGNALGFVALFGLVFLALWALLPRLPVVGRCLRANYQQWLTLHRVTGLFVIVGLIHGLLVDPVLRQNLVLLVWYLAMAALGTAAYLYQELLHPLIRRLWQHHYTVEAVNQLNQKTVEVILTPTGQPVSFVAGQFLFVRFGGGHGWERHPFTVSSAPKEACLHLSIKALGDQTQRLIETLQPGIPARVGRAFGMFDYRRGRSQQVWIAGGIGITPFRSWIHAFPTEPPFAFDIDFYYMVHNEDEALFLEELRTTAAHYPTFHPHIIYSKREGPLTMEHIASRSRGPLSEKEVYLCGQEGMIHHFQRALRRRGVPSHHIHYEHFNFR